MFSKILGVLVVVAGLVVAGYVGLVVILVGGISEVIDGFNVKPHDSHKIGWGIARALLATTVTEFFAFFAIVAGVGLCINGSFNRSSEVSTRLRRTAFRNKGNN
jgi:hypothetical protein